MLQRIKYFVRAENAEETLVFGREAVQVLIEALPKPDAAGQHDMRAIERISSFSWMLKEEARKSWQKLGNTHVESERARLEAIQGALVLQRPYDYVLDLGFGV